jgi:hypothetical protein
MSTTVTLKVLGEIVETLLYLVVDDLVELSEVE